MSVAGGILLLLLLHVIAWECAGSASRACALGAAATAAVPVLGAACCAGALCAVSCTSLLRGGGCSRVAAAAAERVLCFYAERGSGSDSATLV